MNKIVAVGAGPVPVFLVPEASSHLSCGGVLTFQWMHHLMAFHILVCQRSKGTPLMALDSKSPPAVAGGFLSQEPARGALFDAFHSLPRQRRAAKSCQWGFHKRGKGGLSTPSHFPARGNSYAKKQHLIPLPAANHVTWAAGGRFGHWVTGE